MVNYVAVHDYDDDTLPYHFMSSYEKTRKNDAYILEEREQTK